MIDDLIVKPLDLNAEEPKIIRARIIRTVQELITAHNELVRLLLVKEQTIVSPIIPIKPKGLQGMAALSAWVSLLIAWRYVCLCVGSVRDPDAKIPLCKFCHRIMVEEDE